MKNLIELRLGGTSIGELPLRLEYLTGLRTLELINCKNLEFIPNSICNLKHLQRFGISYCPKIDKFPTIAASLCSLTDLQVDYCSSLSEISNEIGCLSSLRRLSLLGSNITTIPAGIKLLINLVALWVSDSKRLQSLPDLPPSLVHLEASNYPSLTKVSNRWETISGMACHSINYDVFIMNFSNCLNLDPYARDNILGEMENAVKNFSFDRCTPHEMIVKVPGSEILKWFPYQSSGPSLTIKWIPPTSGMIRFVLCVVFAIEDRIRENELAYKWETKIGDHLTKMSRTYFQYDINEFFEQDHMIVNWYFDWPSDPHLWCNSDGYHNVTFTILHPHPDKNNHNFKVKIVGVNPIILSQHNNKRSQLVVEGEHSAKIMKKTSLTTLG
ncbi:Disease resistance protein (TIR-NBS-LRR class) [Quillaja saponaria]|uniref:Disease resistance protein (TIR-NBS-LRR class) n=1 Tax=Quillaja saponaria TaxID=32244 RepID=A0AAD7LPG6_QUISA|nr:Disease resistance protein (TIR-NBS-LRR class) [Quillaja saponaria]